MRKIASIIMALFIGFFGMALIIDEPNLLIIKAKIFFWGIVISFILLIIDETKN